MLVTSMRNGSTWPPLRKQLKPMRNAAITTAKTLYPQLETNTTVAKLQPVSREI